MLTIWGRATSLNVQKVMWTVAELGLPHKRVDVGGAFGGLDSPAFAALTPHRLIPVVETADGLVLWESNAIVRHLALHDPERRLWPAGGQIEASADMWAEWGVTFARPMIALFWALVRTPPSKRDAASIEGHRADAVAMVERLDTHMGGREFMVGDALTIADINIGPILYRWYTMEIERPPVPAVDAYYQRLAARETYATHAMVDYSSLRATD